MIFKYMLATILGLLLIGCSTKYKPDGLTGGFTETQLSADTFVVSFNGNAYTSREQASEYALLRSAEISLNAGYKYFIIINSEKYVKNYSRTSPVKYETSFEANTFGNQTYGTASTKSSGGETTNYEKPRISNTIKCFNDKPNLNTLIYEAELIKKSLKIKYGIAD